jgi:cell division protein FtsA
MEEIFNMVDAEIRQTGMADGLSAGVILTGGGAALQGADVLAEQILGVPVKIGIPDRLTGPREVTHDPGFATSVGLIKYGLEGRYFYEMPSSGWVERLTEDIRSWFS